MSTGIPDLVVLLPGIGGSELVKGSRVIWGWYGAVLLRNMLMSGPLLRDDLLVEQDSPTEGSLDDGIRPSRLLPDLHLLPGLWKIDGYSALHQFLHHSFELHPGKNLFPFPYDWRRDNRAAAHRLRHLTATWLSDWRKTSGNADARLVLIAHSMGGLIARYFLEVLEGWRNTRALITIGTPHAGSVNVAASLVNGIERYGVELTDILRRMPSLYQLLPTYPCLETGDSTLRTLVDATLPGLQPRHVQSGVAFHHEIATAESANLAAPEYLRNKYRLFSVAGCNQPTHKSVRLRGHRLELLNDTAVDGDGTVTTRSAIPPLQDDSSVRFTPARHAVLHDDDNVRAQLHSAISSLYEQQTPLNDPAPRSSVRLGLDIEDIYWSDSPLTIRACCESADLHLTANVTAGSTGRQVRRAVLHRGADGWQLARLPSLHPGIYRVTVSSDNPHTCAIRDVFEVASRELVRSASA